MTLSHQRSRRRNCCRRRSRRRSANCRRQRSRQEQSRSQLTMLAHLKKKSQGDLNVKPQLGFTSA